jgi:transposase
MRFVPIKNANQQALLALHRARQGFVIWRIAQVNQIRGLLAEFGLVMPVGIRSIERKLPEILEDAENGLSGASRALFARLVARCRRRAGWAAHAPCDWWARRAPGATRPRAPAAE